MPGIEPPVGHSPQQPPVISKSEQCQSLWAELANFEHGPASPLQESLIASAKQALVNAGCAPHSILGPTPSPGGGSGAPSPGVTIVGVENTQAIQFCNLTGQGTGMAADNSVPLVAGKDVILRVYVDAQNTASGDSVGGVAMYDLGSVNQQQVLPLNAASGLAAGFIPAQPIVGADRGGIDTTLNFLIPAAACAGELLVKIYVGLQSQGFSPYNLDSAVTLLTGMAFSPVPVPSFHAVLVGYSGPNTSMPSPVTLPTPPKGDIFTTLAKARRIHPVTALNTTSISTMTCTVELGTQAGWGSLLGSIQQMRLASDGSNVLLGFVSAGVPLFQPAGQPTGIFVTGMEGSGCAAFRDQDLDAAAHELGHAFGRSHSPGSVTPTSPPPLNIDPNYPVYPNDVPGSIGEFGFDPVANQVLVPAGATIASTTNSDIMSYRSPKWVSPYTYEGCRTYILANDEPAMSMQMLNVVEVGETLRVAVGAVGDGYAILNALHLPAQAHRQPLAAPGGLQAQLLDAAGKVLESGPALLTMGGDVPDDGFAAVLTWNPAATRIVVLRGETVLATADIDPEPPTIGALTLTRAERGADLIRLTWQASHPRQPISAMVRYSADGGKTWRALAAGITDGSYLTDLGLMQGASGALFQVAATAGFRTALTLSSPLAVPVKKRVAEVLAPAAGQNFAFGQTVHFAGGAWSPDYGVTSGADTRWRSDVDGVLGVGDELLIRSLSRGRHTISLETSDGAGGTVTASVAISVGGVPLVLKT